VFYIDVAKIDRHGVMSNVCSDCFICFRRMLHVFHLEVAKVDLDVSYICMVVSVCF